MTKIQYWHGEWHTSFSAFPRLHFVTVRKPTERQIRRFKKEAYRDGDKWQYK